MVAPVCIRCGGARWVCEHHPDRPWDKNLPNGCECGPGAPCPLCNSPENGEAPRMPPDFVPTIGKDGSRQ
jgi:hypothetical protein